MRVLFLSALLLTGCATMDYEHTDGGRIVHSPFVDGSDRIQAMADESCARQGKAAILEEPDSGSGKRRGSYYRCVEP